MILPIKIPDAYSTPNRQPASEGTFKEKISNPLSLIIIIDHPHLDDKMINLYRASPSVAAPAMNCNSLLLCIGLNVNPDQDDDEERENNDEQLKYKNKKKHRINS